MNRRTLIEALGLSAVAVTVGALALNFRPAQGKAQSKSYEFELTDAQWRQRLSPEAYRVLRQASTERPFSSALNEEHGMGIFACAGCDLPLYDASAKFNSGTGWPSFFQALPKAVLELEDRGLFSVRTEIRCRRCGGHLGHVFDDGPKPTGKRYCMNGVALKFLPKAKG
jgi:peptide-methionine (R)-S-oxide reductase